MLNPMQARGTILLQPRLVNSYYNLGLICAQQKDWNAAIAAYKNALKLEENWFIYFGLGEVYVQTGEELQAINYYQRTIELQPDRAEVHHQLGDLLHKQQRWDEAIRAYQKAIELNPSFSWSYNNLGDSLRDFQRWEAAELSYGKAIDLNPSFVFSHYNLGEVCAKQEKWQAAIHAYQKAIELDPKFADAYSHLGDALKEEKQWDEAITCYEKAIELEPNLHFSVYQSLGDLLSKQQALQLSRTRQHRKSSIQAGTHSISTNDIVIATSIAPVGIEKQRAAIETWLELGFTVVSLNIQAEIDKLKPQFPEIIFHRVERDARQQYGKPFVYVNDVLSYLEGCGASIVGIVNSDIHLRTDLNFLSYLKTEAENSMIFASRIDIDSAESETGEMYGYGFDFFFFDRYLLKDFPVYDEFCLGIPWWDYWVPLTALQNNFNTKYLQNTVAYHVKHPINYSVKNWREVGIVFAKIFDRELGHHLQELLDTNRLEELDEELGPNVTYEFIQMVYQTTHLLKYQISSSEMLEKAAA